MEKDTSAHLAAKEKGAAALSSVVAAVVLTIFKLIVGLLTNSLGILSEAAHSGLDLVAALVTFFAVRIADKPPDREHQYGHGKVENFSALIETVLLLATCGWIVYEALHRLLASDAERIDASVWAFAVMGVSIVVDVSRSRMLMRAAKKHRSQALEADALHFSTDIWSSSVVIVGLFLVRLADSVPSPYREWLLRADAGAALIVAAIVAFVSLQLGKRTVDALLDRAPAGLEESIRGAVARVAEVQAIGQVRIRPAGPTTFAEVSVRLAPDLPTARAHQVTGEVRGAILDACPDCDVTVYVEPAAVSEEDIAGQARAVAAEHGLQAHDVHVLDLGSGCEVDVDIDVPEGLSLEAAHQLVTDYEQELSRRVPQIARVAATIRVESASPDRQAKDVTAQHGDLIAQIQSLVAQSSFEGCHDVRVFQVEEDLHVDMHCTCGGDLTIKETDARTVQLRRSLRAALPQVAHFLVHVEPASTPG